MEKKSKTNKKKNEIKSSEQTENNFFSGENEQTTQQNKHEEKILPTEKETKPDADLLQSAYTNIQSGIKGIEYLIPESQSTNFSAFLVKQNKSYHNLQEKARKLAEKHNLKIKPNGWFKNAKMWISIKFSCFGVDDSQRLSELMIMGNFFGCVDMIKALADSKNANKEILDLAHELKTLEEDCINGLIPFLERTKIWFSHKFACHKNFFIIYLNLLDMQFWT